MSDEIHIQSAMRHVDQTALLPWQALAPDEEAMRREENFEEGLRRRAWLLEVLMGYLFADGTPEKWENVAVRALAVLLNCFPDQVTERDMEEAGGLRKGVELENAFVIAEFVRLCEVEEFREMLDVLMRYIYPARRRRLFKGTQTAYLLAWAYLPGLVKLWKLAGDGEARRLREVPCKYEDMARIFHSFDPEQYPDGPERLKARNKVRSRWSAMAKAALRRRIEDAGGKVGRECGKSASARKAMARSAKGNRNRNETSHVRSI